MSETNNDSQPAPRLTELTTRYGRLAVPDADGDLIGRFLTRYGEWAWLEAAFAASVISDGARILDVGAFVGTFGLGVAQMRSLGSLYFVEANAAVAPLLQSNIADKIPCPMAVVQALVTGAEAGAKNRRYDPGNLGSMSFAAADDSAAPGAVRALTLADLRAQYGSFDLIKLDVEGMELEALRGDADFLSKGHTTLWIEANEDPRTLDVARLLLSWNLELFYFAFPAFNPRNFNGDSEAIFPFAFEAGLLAAPKVAPSLSQELEDAGCILKQVRSLDDLKNVLWRTPRWGMAEWQTAAGMQELAALVGRSVLGETFAAFLAPDTGTAPVRTTIWQRLETEQLRREQADENLRIMTSLAAERKEVLDKIQSSTTWRVTGPVRRLVGRKPALHALLRKMKVVLVSFLRQCRRRGWL